MKSSPWSGLSVPALVLGAGILLPGCSTQAVLPKQHAPQVSAHRGGAMHRPENTMPAFRHALEIGADILEFDMVMTADDRIVVHHDASINPAICVPDAGSSVRPGPVRAMTFADTQQFDCGSQVRKGYDMDGLVAAPGARIPSLDEVLRTFAGSNLTLFIETKMPRPAPGVAEVLPEKFAALVDEAVREYGLEDRVILQSADYRTIDALHTINPRIRGCLLAAQTLDHEYLAAVRRHHADCIVLRHQDADAVEVRQLRDAGVLVYSGMADTQDDWEKYLQLGVDVIFTNRPQDVIAFLKQRGLRN